VVLVLCEAISTRQDFRLRGKTDIGERVDEGVLQNDGGAVRATANAIRQWCGRAESRLKLRIDCGNGLTSGYGVGRGCGVGRGLGSGVALGVEVGIAVAVGVGVGVGVGVTVAVAVGVGVGVGVAADCAQYRPPVFKKRLLGSL
jgi:hypothetical protein